MKIFSGLNDVRLTQEICKVLTNELKKLSSFGINEEEITTGKLQVDKFSDGEILPLFKESVRDEDIFFVNTTNSSDSIMETLLVIDAAKRAGCNHSHSLPHFKDTQDKIKQII